MLAEYLLKGFFCHRSLAYCPYFSQQYTEQLWAIRLYLTTDSCNPNEALVVKTLLPLLSSHFENQDTVLLVKWNPIHIQAACTLKETKSQFMVLHSVGDAKKLQQLLPTMTEKEIWMQQKCLGKHTHLSSNFCKHICEDKKELFYVAPSKIPNGGLGLFSYRHFHRGDKLLTFKGRRWKDVDKFQQQASACAIEYAMTGETFDNQRIVFDPTQNNQFDVDIAKKTDNFAPFINEPMQSCHANAETVSVSNPELPLRVDIYACCHIAPHDEITMMYLRDPEKSYLPGQPCVEPLALELAKPKRKAMKSTLICLGMHPQNNLDAFRLMHLYNEHLYDQIITCDNEPSQTFAFCTHTKVMTAAQLRSLLQSHTNVTLYVDHAKLCFKNCMDMFGPFLLDSCWHLAQSILLPFHPTISSLLTRQTRFCFEVSEPMDNHPLLHYTHYYGWNQLDVTKPYLVLTPTSKHKPFLDTFDSFRIIQSHDLTDEETIAWLQKYNTNNKQIFTVPPWKPLTKQFVDGGTR